MELNKFNVFIDPQEININLKNSYLGLTIRYGEYKNKWGFVLCVQSATKGQGSGLAPMDIIYNSKKEMTDNAYQKSLELLEEYLPNNNALKQELKFKIDDLKFEQLELF